MTADTSLLGMLWPRTNETWYSGGSEFTVIPCADAEDEKAVTSEKITAKACWRIGHLRIRSDVRTGHLCLAVEPTAANKDGSGLGNLPPDLPMCLLSYLSLRAPRDFAIGGCQQSPPS